MQPFDYVNALNKGENLFDNPDNPDLVEKGYTPFLTNKAFSFHVDTALYANDMNLSGHLSHKAQYYYFLHTIKPRKRYGKWPKATKSEDIETIQNYYKVNLKVAQAYAKILSREQIDDLKTRITTGGS